MNRFLFVSMIFLAFMISFGCKKSTGPDPEPVDTLDAPTALQYVTYQDSVKITWTASRDAGKTGFAGYFVYRRENAGFSGLNDSVLATLKITPEPITENQIVVHGLLSERKHYFAVRSVKISGSDTTLSSLSNTVDTSPTIWFSGTLYESAGGASALCAIDFDNQIIYEMNLAHLNHIDIYLGVDDSMRLALCSPSRYGTEWTSRVAEIKRLGVGTIGLASFQSAGTAGWTNRVTLYPSEVYAIRISSHYSKIFIESFVGGVYPNRAITFSAAYQDVENYDHF